MRGTALLAAAAAIAASAFTGNGAAHARRHAAPGPDWLARAQRDLAAREYHATRNGSDLQAPNRAHALRTYFAPGGITVRERDGVGAELVGLALAEVGRRDARVPVAPGAVSSERARVEIARPGVVEWFENSPAGVEQGFTVAYRPDGDGDLLVELDVRGARASLRDESVLLTAATGRRLAYGKLAANDARGRELPARFEIASAQRVRIAVDDTDAVYPVVIDPLLTGTADTRLEGKQHDASLGWSVAGAGDVNGDGYDDVIVGAPYYDAGQIDEGAAFVFLGSASGVADGDPGTAPARLESDQVNAGLGRSVASAGDVNGDGYGDVIVTSEAYDGGPIGYVGAAFLFLGGASGIANGTPATAAAQLDALGYSAAGAGDVNGDGYDDVIAAGSTAALFLGSATGIGDGSAATAATRLDVPFGVVASAGDVNGDGYGDVVIGSAGWSDGEPFEGAAFVFHGSATGIPDGDTTTAAARIESDQYDGGLGNSVAGAGDVDGDGYSDLIVGASRYDAGETNEGAAFVFLGSANGIVGTNPSTAATRLESNVEQAAMGASVAGAGDVNGDGRDDVIVGAPGNGYFGAGFAYVFLGGGGGIAGGGPDTAAVRLESTNGWYHGPLGGSVAGAGDVNGDGYDDVIAGDPAYVTDYAGGAAYVFHGGPFVAVSRLASGQMGDHFGLAVAGAGDVNADGFDDVIVGAPWYDGGQADEGAAFVFLGSPAGVPSSGLEAAAARLESNQAGANLGSVAGAGDVNGDGYDDVIVAAWTYDAGQTNEGAAFVFLGSATGIADGNPATAATQIETNWELDSVFGSVAGAGDVNGDGYDDVVVGAYGQKYVAPDLTSMGAALVYHGSAAGIADGSPDTADTRIVTSEFRQFGVSVAGAGDVNGDGYGDVIVGDVLREAAFVYHGRAGGIPDGSPGTAETTISSSHSSTCWLGFSVAGAGDVNGDGFDDVIVGAPCPDDNDFEPRSAAFVFHGSASGIPSGTEESAATRFSADQKRARMGGSVAGVGDVTGDGYDDVIVGAGVYNDTPAQTPYDGDEAGAAFVFAGSASGVASGGPDTAALEIAPGHSFAWLGWSVAGAGDVNGDGHPDLIVGAPGCFWCQPPPSGMALIVLPEPGPAIAMASGIGAVAALVRRRRLTIARGRGNAPCE